MSSPRSSIATRSSAGSGGSRRSSGRSSCSTTTWASISNEIGEVLDIPAGTARSRLHYAHRAMRALLEADARPTAVAGGRSS